MQEALYHAHLLDHARNPRNKGVLEDVAGVHASNPSCGDTLMLYVATDGTTITEIAFTGEGCALSQSGASMLTEALKGTTLAKARAMTEDEALALFGAEITYARKKCALLAFRAFEDWIHTNNP